MPFKTPIRKEYMEQLADLQITLMKSLKDHSAKKSIQTKKGTIQYQEFYPKNSKPVMDEIDRVLAKHYDFTEEELDFIINYDIKYRMGQEAEADAED